MYSGAQYVSLGQTQNPSLIPAVAFAIAAALSLSTLPAVAGGPEKPPTPAPSPTPKPRPPGPWTPDLVTVSGRLTFFQSPLSRHPQLPTANLQFQRNLFEVVGKIPEIRAMLGDNAAPSEIGILSRLTHEYIPGGQWKYDDDKVDDLKRHLAKAVDGLKLRKYRSLEEDLVTLKTEAGKGGDDAFKKALRDWFDLLPFLYDDKGTAKHPTLDSDAATKLKAEISGSTPPQLKNLYGDFLEGHLESRLEKATKSVKGTGAAWNAYLTNRQQFLDKPDSVARKALTPAATTADKNSQLRALTLEELPPDIATMRGCFGGDCSIATIAYYVLIKGVKVYAIRKSRGFEGQPSGYVLAIPVQVDGKTLPYIVTVNGAGLSVDDVQAAVRMVMKDWGVHQAVVPDLSKNPNVVNTAEMKQGLTYANAKPVTVEMPKGWDKIDEISDVYYRAGRLQHAYLVEPNTTGEVHHIKKVPTLSAYQPGARFDTQPPLGRAILAAQAAHGTNAPEEVLKTLNVTEAQVSAARALVGAHIHKPLTAGQLAPLEKEFGYKVADLAKLDMLTAAHSIGHLFETAPLLGPSDEWRTVTQKIYDKLTRSMNEAAGDEEAIQYGLRAQLALPKAFRPSDEDILKEQIAKLSATDPRERATGIRALDFFRESLPASALTKVTDLLQDPEPVVRMAAIAFLRKGEKPTNAIRTRLEGMLADPAAEVRARAFEGLAEWYGEEPIFQETAAPLLADTAEEVRAKAVRYFIGKHAHSQRVVALLAPNLSLSDSDLRERVASIVADSNVTDPRIQRHVELLLDDASPPVRVAALNVIPRFIPVTKELRASVVRMLQDPDPSVRKAALEAVKKIKAADGGPVRSTVVALLADEHSEVRSAAADVLGYQHDLKELGELLALYQQTKNDKIRGEIEQRLQYYVADEVKKPFAAQLLPLLDNTDPALVRFAARRLGHFTVRGAHTAKLVALLQHADPDVRLDAIGALSTSPDIQAEHHLALAGALSHPVPEARRLALDAIKNLVSQRKKVGDERVAIPIDKGVLPKVIDLFDDPEKEVRERALSALGWIAKEQPAHKDEIAKLIAGKRKQQHAIEITPHIPAADLAHLAKMDDEDIHVRWRAENALKERKDLPVPYLLRLLAAAQTPTKHPDLHSLIEHFLKEAESTHPAVHEAVRELTRSKDASVRAFGLTLLKHLKEPSVPVVDMVFASLGDTAPEVRKKALELTESLHLRNTPRADMAFLPLLADVDKHVRESAGSAMSGRFELLDVYEGLLALYKATKDPKVREGVEARFYYEPPDKLRAAVTEKMAALLDDTDPEVVKFAVRRFRELPSDAAVVAKYLKLLPTADPVLRASLLTRLTYVAHIASADQLTIAEALTDKTPEVRLEALDALKNLTKQKNGETAIPVQAAVFEKVADRLDDAERSVRDKAKATLEYFATELPKEAPAIAALLARKRGQQLATPIAPHMPAGDLKQLANLRSDDWQKQQKARSFFAEKSDLPVAYLLRLLEEALSPSPDSPLFDTIEKIFEAAKPTHPLVHAAVLKLLESTDASVRLFGLELLPTLKDPGPEIAAAALRLHRDPDAGLRRKAIDTAHTLRVRDTPEGQTALLDRMVDPDAEVRTHAGYALGNHFNDISTYDTLLAMYRQNNDAAIRKGIEERLGGYVRDEMIAPLRARFTALLRDPDPQLVQLGTRLFTHHVSPGSEAIQHFVRVAADSSSRQRLPALTALRSADVIEEQYQPRIAQALRSRDAAIREEALEVLKKLTNEYTQRRKIRGADKYKPIPIAPIVPAMVVELLGDENGDLRRKAMDTLEAFVGFDPKLQAHIDALIDDKRTRLATGEHAPRFPKYERSPNDAVATEPATVATPPAPTTGPIPDALLPLVTHADASVRARAVGHLRDRELSDAQLVLIAKALVARPDHSADALIFLSRQKKLNAEVSLAIVPFLAKVELSERMRLVDRIAANAPHSITMVRALLAQSAAGNESARDVLSQGRVAPGEAKLALVEALSHAHEGTASAALSALQVSGTEEPGVLEKVAAQLPSIRHESVKKRVLEITRPLAASTGDWRRFLDELATGNYPAMETLQRMNSNDPAYVAALVDLLTAEKPSSALPFLHGLFANKKLTAIDRDKIEARFRHKDSTSDQRAYIIWSSIQDTELAPRLANIAAPRTQSAAGIELMALQALYTTHRPDMVPALHTLMIRHFVMSGSHFGGWALDMLGTLASVHPDTVETLREAERTVTDPGLKVKCGVVLSKFAPPAP